MVRRWLRLRVSPGTSPGTVLALVSVLLLLLLVGLVVGLDVRTVSGECRRVEAEAYPRLEEAAHDVLGEVGDTFTRSSNCEDTVTQPGAVVFVSVHAWSARSQARRYLVESGIDLQRPADRSPDYILNTSGGAVSIRFDRVEDHFEENSGDRFVRFAFTAAS